MRRQESVDNRQTFALQLVRGGGDEFDLVTVRLGKQSGANRLGRTRAPGLTTFSHRIANDSPFGVDRIANGNRTERETRMARFAAKFSAVSLPAATYGHAGV